MIECLASFIQERWTYSTNNEVQKCFWGVGPTAVALIGKGWKNLLIFNATQEKKKMQLTASKSNWAVKTSTSFKENWDPWATTSPFTAIQQHPSVPGKYYTNHIRRWKKIVYSVQCFQKHFRLTPRNLPNALELWSEALMWIQWAKRPDPWSTQESLTFFFLFYFLRGCN